MSGFIQNSCASGSRCNPIVVPGSPDFVPVSPSYYPTSPQYCVPESPEYVPVSPVDYSDMPPLDLPPGPMTRGQKAKLLQQQARRDLEEEHIQRYIYGGTHQCCECHDCVPYREFCFEVGVCKRCKV